MARWPLQTEIGLIRQALQILEPRQRRQLLLLLPANLTVAVLELAALAPLAPFIALLAEPSRFEKHRMLRWAYKTFGFSSTESLFLFMGLSILALLVVSNVVGATTTWVMLRFAWMRDASLSTRLLRSYLYRPYPFFLERNTADLIKKSLMDVHYVAIEVMWHLMALVARSFVIVLIAGALFFIEPMLACGAIFVFGGLYGGLFTFSRRWATRSGQAHTVANARRFHIATDALQGAKEVKLYRLEDAVVERFEQASIEASASASNQNLLAQLPRYALETVAFGAMLVMMLYLLKTRHTLQGALPVLGLYIFAAMRLLPALQAVFGAVNTIRYHSTVVGQVAKEFEGEQPQPDSTGVGGEVTFENAVRFEDVAFSYVRSPRPVLEHLSLTIRRGEWAAFVGPTGSGKSTLVDLMLGLLEPTSGTISIDGVSLTPERHRAWQAQTGYVPQQIFLVNDTVEANICFGIAPDRVDRALMEKVARIAQIHDFITRELANGYQTVVGDRGNRLSGGQRQRIGVARALYRWPRFLVLDEATSALDGATESAFFEALRVELRHCTVISVTHRMTTTRNFDRVYRLQDGCIAVEPRADAMTGKEAVG
jgi:ABC-type multidrug transport system fused ATPase/permease subunit